MSSSEATIAHQPSVAIVILNWNGFDDTVECLQSLRHTTYGSYEIILVDNGSENDQGERLKELFPEVQLICNTTNRGFAGGCNDGIRRAVAGCFEYVVMLNNDTLVEADWLGSLVRGLVAAGADFGSSRIMYYPEKHLICSDGDGLFPDGTGFVVNSLKQFQEPGRIRPIVSACGAAAIFSTHCLEAIKLFGSQYFDELFFAYFEDIDLSLRLHALGFEGVSIPDAVVYHKESKTAGQRSFFQIYQNEKNRILIELLNYPLWMIAVGELYFFIETGMRNLMNLLIKRAPRKDRPLPVKNFSPWTVLVHSRKWLLSHASEILADRRERKARGMIDRRVYRHLYWDFSKMLGMRRWR